jgi:hypothetical protein
MSSLPPEFIPRCRSVFLSCKEFDSLEALKPVFLGDPLGPFAVRLPTDTHNKEELADEVVQLLLQTRLNDGTLLLVPFLKTLRDKCPVQDDLYTKLNDLYQEVIKLPPPPPPSPPWDDNAWRIVQRQLNDSLPISQEQLDAAVVQASLNMRKQIYELVDGVLTDYLADADTVPNIERTIPIFRTLIASDAEKTGHMYHGDLGIVLNAQRHSTDEEVAEAEAELTTAIEMRGKWEDFGVVGWEFNRAECRIRLDDDFNQGKKSAPKLKGIILADLKVADSNPDIGKYIQYNSTIKRWLKLNRVPLSKFRSLRNET